MTRYDRRDTLEPMLGESAGADEDIQQLVRKLRRLASGAWGWTGSWRDFRCCQTRYRRLSGCRRFGDRPGA